MNCKDRQVPLKPVETPQAAGGVNEKFIHQVDEFIEQYRPALEALAK